MKPEKENLLTFLAESNAIERVYDEDSLKQAKRAWDYLIREDTLSVGVILKAHKILMLHQPIQPNQKGYLRQVDVWVGGKPMPRPLQVPYMLDNWVAITRVPILKGTEELIKRDHIGFERIHPFVDGNGRIGRLLLNWQRVKTGLPILVIKDETKNDPDGYYSWFKERE